MRACQARGWDVQGPLPADTLFSRAGRGDFDIVVAMYQDQGHGPVKVLGIEVGVTSPSVSRSSELPSITALPPTLPAPGEVRERVETTARALRRDLEMHR